MNVERSSYIPEYTLFEKDRLFQFYYALNMFNYLENAFGGDCDQLLFQSTISGDAVIFHREDVLSAYRSVIIPDILRSLRDMGMLEEAREAIVHDRMERSK